MGGRPVERCVAQCSGKIWVFLALEFSGLNLNFQGLKFVVVAYGPNEGDGEERDSKRE